MSDKKELLTIAVIAAALMMVLGTSIPSSVLASTSIEAAQPADDSGNDDTGSSGGNGNDESANGNNDEDDSSSSNDGGNTGSKDDGENDEDSDDSSGDNDGSDSSSGVPESYLGEYSTCVSDLSSDDSILSQDDVVDCYGQVFGPNPTHDLGPLSQNAPTSPATGMPGFENMPSALQPGDQQQMQPLGQTQPQDGQQLPIEQQQQSYPAVGDQQQAQPLGQTQPQEGQQAQPLGQTQPQDGQQLPIEQQQQQQPQTGLEGQHQMSPTTGLPIDAGILDVETIKEIVKSRLAQ